VPDLGGVEQCARESRRRKNRQEEGEGCNIYGTMSVARVSGSFHIAPAARARASRMAGLLLEPPKLTPAQLGHFNTTHHVRRFSFGTDFPGQRNPLDDLWSHSPGGAAVVRYFLKAPPSIAAHDAWLSK
jgi:hypothetical protein